MKERARLLLDQLIEYVRAQGVIVDFVPLSAARGRAGYFRQPNEKRRRPIIKISRPERADTPGDPEDELFTVAHEFGHFLSYAARGTSEEYARYLEVRDLDWNRWPELEPAKKALIFDEEERAWELGRGELVRIGLGEFQAFEVRRMTSLDDYRARLALPAPDATPATADPPRSP
jgi:hypothetical protein